MSEDERPEEERGQDELIAAFAALDGRLTTDELMRRATLASHAFTCNGRS